MIKTEKKRKFQKRIKIPVLFSTKYTRVSVGGCGGDGVAMGMLYICIHQQPFGGGIIAINKLKKKIERISVVNI